MWRSTLPKIASVLTALLLVLQHVPLNYTGGGHGQCIHCTSTYCTMDHQGAHDHGADDAVAAVQPPGEIRQEHSHEAHEAGHSMATDDGKGLRSGAQASGTSTSAQPHTRMETCGSGPPGVVLITLDKFYPSDAGQSLPAMAVLSFPEPAASHRWRISSVDIFHPPAAGI
ncbi:MAG: hypothetical protein WED81_08380 [Rhodothermales bacterium]